MNIENQQGNNSIITMIVNGISRITYFLSKSSKLIIVVGLLILLAIPMIHLMYLFGIGGAVSYVSDKIYTNSGINKYLINGILILLIGPFIWSTKSMFSFSLNPFNKNKVLENEKKRIIGFSIFTVYIALYYFTMFFITQSSNFNRSGEAIKWYCRTPEGLYLSDGPGFDPKYGLALQPMDSKTAMSLGYKINPPKKLENPLVFFDYATQAPIVWYYENQDGTFDFFDQPGFHPKYRQELKPITPEIVHKFEAKKNEIKAEEDKKRNQEIEEKKNKKLNSIKE